MLCPELLALIGAEQYDAVVMLQARSRSESVLLDAEALSKEQRTALHRLIAGSFADLDSVTELGPRRSIRVARKAKGAQKRRAACPIVRFVLHKVQKDTPSAASLLAKMTHVKPDRFAFAGNKDRRAVTTQFMTVDLPPAQLLGLKPRLIGIRLGDFAVVERHLQLGDLSGNHFTVVLRDIDASEATVQAAMESLQARGFINYFGTQRFGTSSVPTHAIGRALLRGEYEAAAELILKPRASDSDTDCVQARSTWQTTRDPLKAMMLFPPKLVVERQLLQGLVRAPRDFRGAVYGLPRTMRMLYLHSYQSYVWNRMVSARIELFGLVPVVGDLVAVSAVAAPVSGQGAVDDETQEAVIDEEVMRSLNGTKPTVRADPGEGACGGRAGQVHDI